MLFYSEGKYLSEQIIVPWYIKGSGLETRFDIMVMMEDFTTDGEVVTITS